MENETVLHSTTLIVFGQWSEKCFHNGMKLDSNLSSVDIYRNDCEYSRTNLTVINKFANFSEEVET